MARVSCCSCGKPGEIREMSPCPSCGQYICRDCERHYDGYCSNCLNSETDMQIL